MSPTDTHIRSAEEWHATGTEAIARRDVDGAEEAFRQALLLDPQHANALYRLGELAQHRADIPAATYWYGRALDAQPGHAGALKRLAVRTPAAAPQPRPEPESKPPKPPQPPRGSGLVAIARNYQQHQNSNMNRRSVLVISFRLEVPGRKSATQQAVHMRGPELHGSIANGDWIEMPRRWKPGREPGTVRNLTTGETVRFGHRGSHHNLLLRLAGWAFGVLVLLMALAIGALVILGLTDPSGLQDFIEETLRK